MTKVTKLRVVFMGTPSFAVPTLAALAECSDLAEVIAVVTQPDRPRGRGQKYTVSPVKAWAAAHDIPVLQPVRVRDAEFTAQLRALHPDVAVVAAFGQILSQEVLDIPVHGCINVHASLLPHYRGAAPIQYAIMCGAAMTGVTTMQMDAGLDTGDMLLRREVPIFADMTYGLLHDVLMHTGAKLLIETLMQLAAGTLRRIPQMGEGSYAPRITRDMTVIDWAKSAQEIEALVRGLNPTPYARTALDGAVYKIGRLRRRGNLTQAPAGTIMCADPAKGFIVAAGDEELEILEIQAPGKKMMEAGAFLRGHRLREDIGFVS